MTSLSYEEAFAQLEAAVTALQDGKLPLERALQYYEQGMKLAQHCDTLLQKAELSVQQLSVSSDGTLDIQPIEI
ncbi:MAG: exodeoxyribonuclease VII small subunit [Ktedonobacteraceae bacterium]